MPNTGVLDESKRPSGARGTSKYSIPYQYGYVPNGTSTPVRTPWGQIAYEQAIAAGRSYPTGQNIAAGYLPAGGANPSSAAINSLKKFATSGASSGGGRGGGGGGGAGGITQEQMDWMAQLLKAGRPQAQQAGTFTPPAYSGMAMKPFDPSQYDLLSQNFGQAVNQDRATQNAAYNNEDQYLAQYKNAFAGGPPPAQTQGMSQDAMARLLQGQGINPNNNQQLNNLQQGAAAGNAAFGNVWGLLGANEDIAQKNRVLRAQQDRANSEAALNAAALQGNTGIGLQRTQAQTAWQQAADQRAYQDYQMQQQLAQQAAMQNWQRQNQVQDTNATNTQGWNASTIQSLLGLLGKFGGNLPDLASLGLA